MVIMRTKFGELTTETTKTLRNIKYKVAIKLVDIMFAGPNENSHMCSWPLGTCQMWVLQTNKEYVLWAIMANGCQVTCLKT